MRKKSLPASMRWASWSLNCRATPSFVGCFSRSFRISSSYFGCPFPRTTTFSLAEKRSPAICSMRSNPFWSTSREMMPISGTSGSTGSSIDSRRRILFSFFPVRSFAV